MEGLHPADVSYAGIENNSHSFEPAPGFTGSVNGFLVLFRAPMLDWLQMLRCYAGFDSNGMSWGTAGIY